MAIIHPASNCTTPIETYYNNTSLGISTGFYFQQNGANYLVTNWHVLTGKNNITGDHLSSTLAEPNRIKIWQHRTDGNRQVQYLSIEENGVPSWLQHSIYGSFVDIAILPLEHDQRFEPRPINNLDEVPPKEFAPMVGKDVFVLGYPFGDLSLKLSLFPIWKRASIATELNYLVEDQEMFLIDTATKKGMSGSPVVYVAGQFQQFMGVYSGRYGATDLGEVQLGRVWRTQLVSEIIQLGIKGSRLITQIKAR